MSKQPVSLFRTESQTQREESKLRADEAKNRIDPLYADKLRAIVKMIGKQKVLEFVRRL